MIAAAVLVAACGKAPKTEHGPAPAFTLKDLAGGTLSLASLKGKPLPDLKSVNLELDCVPEGKPVLLCLFDVEQRPSRRFAKLVADRTER